MELFQVLHKNIPQKKKVFSMFHKKGQQDISKFFLQMIKNVKKETQDNKMINMFCIQIYDMFYYDIVFNNFKVAKKLLRLIEELALPISYIGEYKRNEIMKKIKKIKL
jgi:hypothetical protein